MFKSDLELFFKGRLLSAKAYAVVFLLGVLAGVIIKVVMYGKEKASTATALPSRVRLPSLPVPQVHPARMGELQ